MSMLWSKKVVPCRFLGGRFWDCVVFGSGVLLHTCLDVEEAETAMSGNRILGLRFLKVKGMAV